MDQNNARVVPLKCVVFVEQSNNRFSYENMAMLCPEATTTGDP